MISVLWHVRYTLTGLFCSSICSLLSSDPAPCLPGVGGTLDQKDPRMLDWSDVHATVTSGIKSWVDLVGARVAGPDGKRLHTLCHRAWLVFCWPRSGGGGCSTAGSPLVNGGCCWVTTVLGAPGSTGEAQYIWRVWRQSLIYVWPMVLSRISSLSCQVASQPGSPAESLSRAQKPLPAHLA